jgi:hypothetical protein
MCTCSAAAGEVAYVHVLGRTAALPPPSPFPLSPSHPARSRRYPPLSVSSVLSLPESYATSDLADAWEKHVKAIGNQVMDLAAKIKKVGVAGVKYRVHRINEDDL